MLTEDLVVKAGPFDTRSSLRLWISDKLLNQHIMLRVTGTFSQEKWKPLWSCSTSSKADPPTTSAGGADKAGKSINAVTQKAAPFILNYYETQAYIKHMANNLHFLWTEDF